MPKMKTNRAAAKRFRRTKNGTVLRHQMGGRHLKTAKSPKRVRNLRKAAVLSDREKLRVKRMLPYS